ncbi:hypothetical protein [Microbacterium phyllosphaerae]|uniref:hypothetical protein n=1 Tax=Microbacterium phyllosphaerae TaxID=124798 RepID=UPI002168C111|nr:hypothetical protein [Microbacterium phyllosphaerae]MCS3442454.1 hypothetical protein [Microbacterium phyllosphaerae]
MTATDTILEIDIERYGQDARVSALADYLEIAALSGIKITRAALQDLIVDNEWVRRPLRRYHLPEEVENDPESWADSVFSMIADREGQLGDLYPFKEQGRSLQLKDPAFERLSSPYLSLLAITAVHAWDLPCDAPVESTLEEVVAGTLALMGLTVANIGATDRGSGFVDALADGAAALGLRAHSNPTPRSVSAKDAGVDTLAGVVWRDYRQAGHWLTLGQVTVAQSQHWVSKLNQPEPARWADYLQELLHPQVFLAVPHHVQDDHLRNIMASRRGLIIDRLRIVARKPANTENEETIVGALLAASVDAP